jgi:hypothetical protein
LELGGGLLKLLLGLLLERDRFGVRFAHLRLQFGDFGFGLFQLSLVLGDGDIPCANLAR